ncbi:MAG: response regulator [Cellvibrionaceae bacterium]|nr:response regulator [Cellvibrionaceae bacterium]
MLTTPKKLASVVLPTILLVQTLVFASMGGLNYWSSKNEFYKKLNHDITEVKNRLHNNLPEPLWNYNTTAIHNILKAEVSGNFVEAIVIKLDGHIEHQISQAWRKDIDFSISEKQKIAIDATEPTQLFYTGEDGSGKVGELFILSSDKELKNNLNKLSINLIVQSIILNLSLAGLILYILYGFIIRPLRKINKGLRDIVQGGHDLSKRLEENAIGELGDLAKDYNRLACYISLIMDDIKAQKIHLEAIFNNVIDGIIIFDKHGNIADINPAAHKIFGYDNKLLHYKNIQLLLHEKHSASILQEIDNCTEQASSFINHTQEVLGIKKNNQQFPMALSISNIEELDENYFIALARDISKQKQLEEEKTNALKKAQESAQLKSEFLASMSHEIRTPMNGVLGMLDLIRQGNLNIQQQHYAALAHSSAKALLGIINDILDFSKIEAGKLELDIIDFDLRSLLGDFAESIAVKAQDKNLELLLDTQGIETSSVRSDPGRVRQILNNIVGNAIKFTTEGEILIRASLSDTDAKSCLLTCEVTDTGIGIPQDKQGRLFESFSQVDASTTRKYGGTGLGLAIVKQLCVLMRGDVKVNSTPGQGSCFTVTLALEKSEGAHQVLPPVTIAGRSLLLVDSNRQNLRIISAQLQHWQAQVRCADSAQQALALLAKKPDVDLMLIALEMPGTDGIALGKIVNTQYPAVKKVMMSSIVQAADTTLLEALGFLTQFPKPATTQDLFALFTLAFKPADDTRALSPAAANTPATDPAAPEDKNILLVEDNLINQEIALANLEMLGFHCDLAENGKEAITKLKAAPANARYDLILMDCQMPEMDGYQATCAIRKGAADNPALGKSGHCANIPIIAMTANAMKGDEEKCIAAGMDDYMTKPIDPDILQAKIKQWLDEV